MKPVIEWLLASVSLSRFWLPAILCAGMLVAALTIRGCSDPVVVDPGQDAALEARIRAARDSLEALSVSYGALAERADSLRSERDAWRRRADSLADATTGPVVIDPELTPSELAQRLEAGVEPYRAASGLGHSVNRASGIEVAGVSGVFAPDTTAHILLYLVDVRIPALGRRMEALEQESFTQRELNTVQAQQIASLRQSLVQFSEIETGLQGQIELRDDAITILNNDVSRLRRKIRRGRIMRASGVVVVLAGAVLYSRR